MLPPLDITGAVSRQAASELAGPVTSGNRLLLIDSKDGKVVADYPGEHLLGMETPKGGSACANCRFLVDGNSQGQGKTCIEAHFIGWEGPNKPAGTGVLPQPPDQYCCDMWQPAPTQKVAPPVDREA